ncbi:Zn-dependent hydrolase [Silvibacterium dinghuense]|uniref:Zn-dependent hydrolase n=1 Tax=Silvibacterium dinghuense TaxID=1560006 RepID=A0A4Q1S9L6_9BACT|nr:Zn-dependent hydrolase [Silvibacterium dinghuense]RXS93356.1 Zn-dependent hydrolase [Silvibacterium dinghuense]GGH05162.1 Zn-dependent hydrolase [Silvibacterium dinghuense]
MPVNAKQVVAKQVIDDLKELRALTADANGAQRVAWTATWQKARDWFEKKLDGLPVEHHLDAAGNRWVTLRGESPKALILGSHLDSVPNGGWLDGALGVTAALGVLRRIAEQYNGIPPVTIRLVDWADEEGARFGRSLFGSSAFAGTIHIEDERRRTDRDGISLETALRECGIDIEKIGDAQREQENAAAYLELHIEQGPVLERLGLPLGVVLGTKGVERHAITFFGQEAHSGSTPMRDRRDALAAAAKLALEIRSIANKHKDSVCTMGSVKTVPGIVTAVVGRCETTLDQRDLDADVLATMYREAQEASRRFAAEEHCTVEWSRIWNIEPVPFHPELIELCEEAVRETSRVAHPLPSGPLHDAAEVARAGIPTVMLFTQSLQGISHNKIEDTKEEHLLLAIEALDRLATKTMAWIATQA